MQCQNCSAPNTRVLETEPHEGEEMSEIYIRRRRYCPRCQSRFTTYEITDVYINYLEAQANLLAIIRKNKT